MKREEFTQSVVNLVNNFIEDFFDFDSNPMLRVNPELKLVEVENGYAFQEDIGYSDEVIESAAAAEGDASESDDDFQAKQNFDYYPVREFVKVDSEGHGTPDTQAIERLADKYFN